MEEKNKDSYSPLEDDYAYYEDALTQKRILEDKLDDTIELSLEEINKALENKDNK